MRRAEQRLLPATRGQAVGATTLTTFTRPTSAVFTMGAGSLIGTLANDSSPTTFTVVASQLLDLSFASIAVTNGVAIVALFND